MHLAKQLHLNLKRVIHLEVVRHDDGIGPASKEHQEAALEVMLQVTSSSPVHPWLFLFTKRPSVSLPLYLAIYASSFSSIQ